jgi:RNA polymerase sigma-70 factor (ECF subfamily)
MDSTPSLAVDFPLAAGHFAPAEAVRSAETPMPAPSDLDLIDRTARGDAQAFSALYTRYARPVFGVLYRLAGRRALAEEWLQEAFTRVWLAAGTHDPARGAVRSWIFKIAVNVARSELGRKRHRTPHVSLEETGLELADHDAGEARLLAALDETRRGQELARALERLPDFMREVVVLRCSRELSFAEIAEVTGAPEGTLKSRFHRAVTALRAALGRSEGTLS